MHHDGGRAAADCTGFALQRFNGYTGGISVPLKPFGLVPGLPPAGEKRDARIVKVGIITNS